MSAIDFNAVTLLESRHVEQFVPVLREIELGDRFLLSMLHWCGIGVRSTPLAYWQIYLIKHAGEIVGVTGLYQRPETPQSAYWITWFGIRPKWRRLGLGSAAIINVAARAKARGGKELWVYTGSVDAHTVKFYESLGFEVLGPAAKYAPSQTLDDSDVVLRLML
ncbi:MAG: GNAT family N-acetyltransferase [Opitutae bacterium]|nr:GNAT family N-acetyltransferase [Opitutae bacterium]